jgi:hypothetical protein
MCSAGLAADNAVVIEDVPAKPFVNKLRAKKGKPPLFEHKIVTIDLNRVAVSHAEPQGGTHASPRFHHRRGHVRHLQDGRMTFVRPCTVGGFEQGMVTHDYRVKAS